MTFMTSFFFLICVSSVQFNSSVMSDSLQPHRQQHARPCCPAPIPRACSNSCPLRWWCHPAISSFVIPFSSRLQSFPAWGCFQMNQFFISGGHSIGVSASASFLQNGYSRLISFRVNWFDFLVMQGTSRVFSNTTAQKHQFFSAHHSLWSNSHIIHDYYRTESSN